MSILDATAKAAISSPAFAAAFYVFLDIAGDPFRFTNGPTTTITGNADAELNGTYVAFGGQLLEIGDVNFSDSGSDTLVITLSGITNIDTSLINEIGDRSKWQGRTGRIWCRLYDDSGVTAQGAIFAFYTGYMSSVKIISEPEHQIIQLSFENWRASFNDPSNRNYLSQKSFDASDTSAQATISAANGRRRDTGGAEGSGGGGYGGGGGGGSQYYQAIEKF